MTFWHSSVFYSIRYSKIKWEIHYYNSIRLEIGSKNIKFLAFWISLIYCVKCQNTCVWFTVLYCIVLYMYWISSTEIGINWLQLSNRYKHTYTTYTTYRYINRYRISRYIVQLHFQFDNGICIQILFFLRVF